MRLMGKLGIIAVLVLVLLASLLSLRGLVHERMARAQEVRAEIAASSARAQRLVGPLLMLTIEHAGAFVSPDPNHADGEQIPTVRSPDAPRIEQRLLAPSHLRMEHALSTQWRNRGLFRVPLYQDEARFQARFTVPELDRRSRIRHLRLVLGLGDNRGLDTIELQLNGKPLTPEPGSGLAWLAQGIHVDLPEAARQPAELTVSGQLGLTGTEALDWLPLADDTEIRVQGDWPHPSFRGTTLPRTREISDQGFHATWRVSRLANTAQAALQQCPAQQTHCQGLASAGFGVSLIEPVDPYRMSERALKYALLQLLLVFGTVFVIEALRERSVHPLHYGLTGAALAMFFLLLLALSEHIGFAPAYLIAALACVGLIGSYLGPVLGSGRLGAFAAALLAGPYGLLYGLLQSEDYALLMGALFLFAFLATIMLGTRRLDWDRLGRQVLTQTRTTPIEPDAG